MGYAQSGLNVGALLQCIPWSCRATYRDIYKKYTKYVTKNYGEAMVVFDGYDGTSTKDMTHQRQSKGNDGVTVPFTVDMHVIMKKDKFLAN